MFKDLEFTVTDISTFTKQYEFLSNFYIAPIVISDIYFPTNEHFFQACKAKTIQNFKFVAAATNPREAKARGRHITIRDNWDQERDSYMAIGLIYKFKNKELRKQLHNTRGFQLYEGNNWGDRYWGYDLDKQRGENKLGQLLMELRDTDQINTKKFGSISYTYTTHILDLI